MKASVKRLKLVVCEGTLGVRGAKAVAEALEEGTEIERIIWASIRATQASEIIYRAAAAKGISTIRGRGSDWPRLSQAKRQPKCGCVVM